MAGSGTTPALATMSTEIVCMIGADLSIHDIKEWTLASKRFRDIFLSQICKHIKFSGNMEQLENNILSYFQTATASFRNVVHNHARCVTFDVQAFDTPRKIFLFMDLVEAGPQWPNVKNLSFQSPIVNAGAIGAVIRKLEGGTLQSPPVLRSSLQGRKDWWWLSLHRDPVIAGLDQDLLARIHISFPQLESLVLYDRFLDDGSSSRPLANSAMLMQSLRRFAFDFNKSRLGPDAISAILERTPLDVKEELCDGLEDEEIADCLLLSLLASQVSTIEEICMTSQYPRFCRATLTDGKWDLDWDSFDDPSQKDLFTSVLMG
ncbi:hypothetical protein FACUT_5549 [Fusarium acutatum]|uniref:Uncharacterized protein n=1 Tax=Fusarium acutatum TaxID=78861 RepID=A0A8H4JRG9_9HYPO|nr:hypothetical protein FACUT_5549 [Fusarium acutatum]